MSSEPEFVSATLAWCNSIRQEQGQEPLDRLPKGRREDPQTCPCGAATGLYVEHTTYGSTERTKGDNELPDAVRAFVIEFDNGLLPQYDLDPIEDPEDE